MNKNPALIFLVGFLAISVVIVFSVLVRFWILPKVGNRVVVKDQRLEDRVLIEEVNLIEGPALLVIKTGPFKVFAAEVYLSIPDTYKNLDVEVIEPEDEDVEKAGDFISAQASLYEDVNSNRSYDDGVDLPMRDLFGNPIRAKFELKLNE